MNFSSILDISSFFIGIIINLLFVALMCYYFKSKYDNLEMAQNEQAKILYEILQKERRSCLNNMCYSKPIEIEPLPIHDSDNIDDDEDDVSDSSSDESEEYDLDNNQVLTNQLVVTKVEDEVKHLSIQEPSETPEEVSFVVTKVEEKEQDDYGKLTMKQLKEILSNKGIKTKPNMRKEELIELIHKKDTDVSASPNFGSFSSENIEIEGMEEISA
jgi:hypothetical protein